MSQKKPPRYVIHGGRRVPVAELEAERREQEAREIDEHDRAMRKQWEAIPPDWMKAPKSR